MAGFKDRALGLVRGVNDRIEESNAGGVAKRLEQARQREARLEEQAKAQHEKPLVVQASLLGSSQPIAGLGPGGPCRFLVDVAGVALVPPMFSKRELLRKSWVEVSALDVQDASRTEIKSSVQQKDFGGLWSPIFTTAPVAKVRSEFVGQSHVTIIGADMQLIVRAAVTEAELNGRLMGLRPSPPQDAPVALSASPVSEADPIDQLERLAKLRDAGAISAEEFETKKAELLRRI